MGASERSRLRGLALAWLTLEVERWKKWVHEDDSRAAEGRRRLEHARKDKDFASVRGEALEKLPEVERKAWQALWRRIEQKAAR